MMLIAFLWVISPFVLIPMTISFGKEKSRLNAFINELLKSGRITDYEYHCRRVDNRDVRKDIQSVEKEMHQEEKLVLPEIKTEPDVRESRIHKVQISAPEPVEIRSSDLKKTNSVSILFGIGVAFVILAGLIFSTAIWVYLSDLARCGVIGLAALFFFGVSLLAYKIRLRGTSSAFYMLGSVFVPISFITAGVFSLFGEWFSVYGEGNSLFFAIALCIFSVFSVGAQKLYKSRNYTYLSLYSLLIAVILFLVQISSRYSDFALLTGICSVIVMAAYHFLKNVRGMDILKPLVHILIAAKIVFTSLSLPLLMIEAAKWSAFSWIVCTIYAAELTYYGLKKVSKLMLSFQSAAVLAMCIELCLKLSYEIDDVWVLFILFVLMAVLTVLYRICRSLYSECADLMFNVTAFISSFVLLFSENIVLGVISMLGMEVLCIVTAFDEKNVFRKLLRPILPVPLMITILSIAEESVNNYQPHAYAVCAALFIAVAFVCRFSALKDKRFITVKYSFEFFAGSVLIFSAASSYNAFIPAILIVLSIVSFAEIHTSDKNVHSLMPVISFSIAVMNLIDEAASDSDLIGNISVIVSMIICAALTLASRLMFGRNLHIRKDKKSHWDTIAAGALMNVLLVCEYHHSSMFSNQARIFILLSEFGIFAANLYRRGHRRNFNCTAVTVSAVFFSLALINRPFLIVSDDIFSTKIIFLIISAFGFAVKKIWRDNKTLAYNLSSAVYMTVYIMLLFDALLNETLFNTLIVLCSSVGILLYSFMVKKKRWFITSSTGLVGLTLYIMRDFLAEINWWVYLLLVGILLIGIASTNEYFKGKGESVKAKAGRFFEDWSW